MKMSVNIAMKKLTESWYELQKQEEEEE